MYAPIQLIHHERAPGELRRAVRSESIGRREEARTSQLAADHGKEGRSSEAQEDGLSTVGTASAYYMQTIRRVEEGGN